MAYAPLPQPGIESPGCYVSVDAGTQTIEEDFFFLEHTRVAGTQTTEEDFDFLSQIQSTSNVSIAVFESTIDASKAAQFENAEGIHPVNVKDEKNFICKVCEKDIEGHSEEGRTTKWYNCCVCRYRSNKRASLQRHINIHCAKHRCDICKREYTEGEPHYREKACNVCKVEFDCKTFLDQHCAVDHEEYFKTHCWVCGKPLEMHSTECGKTSTYVCCSCGYTGERQNSQNHNNTHRPQLFCFTCKEEYPANELDRHGKEFKCLVCKETFQCLTFLEEHFNVNHQVLSSNCMICSEPLYEHKKDGSYHCCVCSRNVRSEKGLHNHLLTHTRLRLFKCDVCGKRFSGNSFRTYHSNGCAPSLFTCKICRARFPTRNSLQDHCSKKHSSLKYCDLRRTV